MTDLMHIDIGEKIINMQISLQEYLNDHTRHYISKGHKEDRTHKNDQLKKKNIIIYEYIKL